MYNQLFASGLATLLLLLFPIAVHAKRVALVIGNASYINESKLKNPINDAKLIESTLKGKQLAFDEVRFVQNGSRLDLLQAFAQFKALAADADVALIYYSGHGMIDSKRSNYILPVDMPKTGSDASLNVDTALEYAGLPEDKLIDAVDRARIQVVIIDACRDNGFAATRSGTKGLSRRVDQSRNRLIAYSTEEGRVAEDGVGSNSTYAVSLAKNLTKLEWPILRIFDQVATDVENATQRTQSPTRTGNLRTDIYFREPPAPVPVLIPPAPPVPPVIARSEEDETWEKIQDKHTRADIEEFLKKYPNSKYRNTAKLILSALDTFSRGETSARENKLWERAVSSNMQTDYEEYLKEYPEGIYAERARKSLGEMEEEVLWVKTDRGSTESVERFIKKYPQSRWTETARQLLVSLQKQKQIAEETAFWASATSIDAIREYLVRYPAGVFDQQARMRLKELEYKPPPLVVAAPVAPAPVPVPINAETAPKPKSAGVMVSF